MKPRPLFESMAALLKLHRPDVLLAIVLSLLAGIMSFGISGMIDPVLKEGRAGDVWFESDIPRVFENMTDRQSDHYRTKVHPLFSLLVGTPTIAVKSLLHTDRWRLARMVVAIEAALWALALFVLFRLVTLRRLDSILFSLLVFSSSTALFWLPIPETYILGSTSILLALILVAYPESRAPAPWSSRLVAALTMSFTITNFFAGILASLTNHGFRRGVRIAVDAFALVTVAWSLQHLLFPTSGFFLGDKEEIRYLVKGGSLLQVMSGFFFHSLVMPSISTIEWFGKAEWPSMLTQPSLPGSGTPFGIPGIIVWSFLLLLGIWALFTLPVLRRFRFVLGLFLCSQLLLHVLYGYETFLYALHFMPPLAAVVALTTRTRLRKTTLTLVGVLTALLVANNAQQLGKALAFFDGGHGSERHQVQTQMRLRPDDPWPRGKGHVLLGEPTAPVEEKAFHEPGGSFSPKAGSFGISIWLTDKKGRIRATSDTVNASEIRQELSSPGRQGIPGVLTATPFYRAFWHTEDSMKWTLDLTPAPGADDITIAVRSVGPAGGRIGSMRLDGNAIIVNGTWEIAFDPCPVRVSIVDETSRGWLTGGGPDARSFATGWGAARVVIGQKRTRVTLTDKRAEKKGIRTIFSTPRLPLISLPDSRFIASLEAQAAHLRMGIGPDGIRPGDPLNYREPWIRDSAYILVALARLGDAQLVRRLSPYVAEHDFYGGFGSEADAPGLALWALTEAAQTLGDPAFDAYLWPHLLRKADLINEMLTAKDLYRHPEGPVLRKLMKGTLSSVMFVSESAQDGLIVGRMDNHKPILFVNATAYRGLLSAASFAHHMGESETARKWLSQAERLQSAWVRALNAASSPSGRLTPRTLAKRAKAYLKNILLNQPPEMDNPRTYITGLWPSFVAAPAAEVYLRGLARHSFIDLHNGRAHEKPLWTYFNISEAHQWLYGGRPDRAWNVLDWFWNNQASPGLYTWWEGSGEENSSGEWENLRGWTNPPHVTPHYWSAAEMLLLQLDMLAYDKADGKERTVVIGSGIPRAWLDRPMFVKGLRLGRDRVDWEWNGYLMKVVLHGTTANVVLGAAFPVGTPVQVDYLRD